MTHATESAAEVFPDEPTVPDTWRRSVLTYLVLAVILGLGAVFAVIVMLPLAFVLVAIAIPYTLIATILILRKRRAARAMLDETQDSRVDWKLANFGGRSQRWSLMNGILLGLLGLLLLASVFLGPWVDLDVFGGSIFVLGLIAMFSAVEIWVNAAWIYGRDNVLSEEYAIRTRTGPWKLIRANRAVGWLIWYTGAIIAGWLLLFYSADALAAAL
ncbi:hypothetical protein D9V29_09200 [Mycetocola manganoxydans]|uniref:Uncharacterized protein n=1 Tax=Mycetocola manganoxydans TaxID=699879 RepID=A0A3L6ZWK0_9MICO|nr:hypothetical protein [Mycetocola manganoxydans]RLP71492.1 hypothetical protein D9V29_09200 [Mycetocola manganoxydans]GHD46831.1 hypothetical protein GCM10008097_17270 [Mycetocola manganoxydans]